MMVSKNPFFFRELSLDSPFCDREKELLELSSYAEGRANVVLFSPRRYGKTSLIRRVQNGLAKKGAITIFVDFFGVSSVEDVAHRLAKAVFEVTRPAEKLFRMAIAAIKSFRPVIKPDESGGVSLSVEASGLKRSGFDVLDDTLSSISELIASAEDFVSIALDEFQEIVQLPEARRIEGIMRSHIQRCQASFFFIGSRRRLLLAMFNDRQRPFFQSAINYELNILPQADLEKFITGQFKNGEKMCSMELAKNIASRVGCHPYYSQKFSFFIFEVAGQEICRPDLDEAFGALIESERPFFEATVQGLALKQLALLNAIAREPSSSVFSAEYMKRHGLGSVGGVQGAIKRLSLMDLIEQDGEKVWSLVDPVFLEWLKNA